MIKGNKITGQVAKNVDPDQTTPSLIGIYTVCIRNHVAIHTIIMISKDKMLFISAKQEPLYNMVHYSKSLDIRWFKE